MAEGFTSSFNPETGERRETRFEYVPVPEMQQQLVSPTQMSETYKYFLSRTNNPKAAIEAANLVLDAAKQFKGRMLYQQAERAGTLDDRRRAELAEDMYARNSGDIYNLARARKALMPPQSNPDRVAELAWKKEQAKLPPKPFYRSGQGGAVNKINPADDTYKTIVPGAIPKPPPDLAARADQEIAKAAYKAAVEELQSTPRKEPKRIPLIGGQFGGNLDEIAELEKKRDEARAKLQGAAPLSARAAATSTGPETIRLTKDGKKAIFDSQTKKFLRYAD